MKLQIDTQEKTIKIEEEVNLGEFIEKLSVTLPEWKEYRLQQTTIINWKDPIVITKENPWIQPYKPYYDPLIPWNPNNPIIICGHNQERSLYNIEM